MKNLKKRYKIKVENNKKINNPSLFIKIHLIFNDFSYKLFK